MWTWNAGDKDDVCGICRVAFDSCPPDAKFPGDDSPVVWGQCGHAFHLQCITRWLNSQAEQRCPICLDEFFEQELFDDCSTSIEVGNLSYNVEMDSIFETSPFSLTSL